MKNPVMYIFVNKGLGMSTGKAASQAAHAAVRSILYDHTQEMGGVRVNEYLHAGETKIVLEVRDSEHLLMAERYLREHGIKCHLVIDEGRTEIPPHTPTAMATEIVDKADEDVQFALSSFKTYKDPKPVEQEDTKFERGFWARNFGNRTVRH